MIAAAARQLVAGSKWITKEAMKERAGYFGCEEVYRIVGLGLECELLEAH